MPPHAPAIRLSANPNPRANTIPTSKSQSKSLVGMWRQWKRAQKWSHLSNGNWNNKYKLISWLALPSAFFLLRSSLPFIPPCHSIRYESRAFARLFNHSIHSAAIQRGCCHLEMVFWRVTPRSKVEVDCNYCEVACPAELWGALTL